MQATERPQTSAGADGGNFDREGAELRAIEIVRALQTVTP